MLNISQKQFYMPQKRLAVCWSQERIINYFNYKTLNRTVWYCKRQMAAQALKLDN